MPKDQARIPGIDKNGVSVWWQGRSKPGIDIKLGPLVIHFRIRWWLGGRPEGFKSSPVVLEIQWWRNHTQELGPFAIRVTKSGITKYHLWKQVDAV